MIVTWLLHDCYMIVTSILHQYYIGYYYLLLHGCYILLHWLLLGIITNSSLRIITSLLHHYYIIIILILHYYYYIIIIKGKSCDNDSMLRVMQRVLLHYYIIITHYPLLPISVSQTCRWYRDDGGDCSCCCDTGITDGCQRGCWHCTAERKTGFRGLDLRLGQLNSNKMFYSCWACFIWVEIK